MPGRRHEGSETSEQLERLHHTVRLFAPGLAEGGCNTSVGQTAEALEAHGCTRAIAEEPLATLPSVRGDELVEQCVRGSALSVALVVSGARRSLHGEGEAHCVPQSFDVGVDVIAVGGDVAAGWRPAADAGSRARAGTGATTCGFPWETRDDRCPRDVSTKTRRLVMTMTPASFLRHSS